MSTIIPTIVAAIDDAMRDWHLAINDLSKTQELFIVNTTIAIGKEPREQTIAHKQLMVHQSEVAMKELIELRDQAQKVANNQTQRSEATQGRLKKGYCM
jgi:hypothetical protein